MPADEIFLIEVARRGATGGNVSTLDWTTIRNDVDDLMGQTPITELDDVPDVTLTSVDDGQVLMYDSGTSKWVNGPALTALSVSDFDTDIADVSRIITQFGIEVVDATGGWVALRPTYGTGANTIAMGNHSHNPMLSVLTTFAATGVLSSGTRTLYSGNTGTLLSGVTYDIRGEFIVRARNDSSSGTFNLLARIGADGSYPELSRNVQTVGGVPVDQLIKFKMVAVGAGATLAVTFKAQFSSGDAVDLRDGIVDVDCRPRR